MTRNPFTVAYVLLAAIAAGSLLFTVQSVQRLRQSPCAASAPAYDPLNATRRFLSTAVAREHVERSYGLVTPELRQGLSCTEWMTGTIPVQPFLEISWRASGFRVVERSRGQALVAVRLVSRSADWPDTAFLLELHATTAGWLASNWVPAATGTRSAV